MVQKNVLESLRLVQEYDIFGPLLELLDVDGLLKLFIIDVVVPFGMHPQNFFVTVTTLGLVELLDLRELDYSRLLSERVGLFWPLQVGISE